jgi:hypothetical protein
MNANQRYSAAFDIVAQELPLTRVLHSSGTLYKMAAEGHEPKNIAARFVAHVRLCDRNTYL